jgi:hypothetical protein
MSGQANTDPSVALEIGQLADLDLQSLRQHWRRLYRAEPPRISRDLLIRGIGYRLQEMKNGGLGKSAQRKLKTAA